MRLFLTLFFVFITSCAGTFQIERHNQSLIRRTPQINRAETGRVLSKGSFCASGGFSYALQRPGIVQVTDSSFEFKSGILGDEITIMTSANTYCYESRLQASGEAMYAFCDVLSAGLLFDASLGQIEGLPEGLGREVKNDNIEGALFLKFAKQYGNIAVSVRPEVGINHLYGDRIWTVSDSSGTKTATEKLSYYSFMARSCSVLRVQPVNSFSPFIGLELKSQAYPLADDRLVYEVVYGVYGGMDLKAGVFAISPFITIPLGSTSTHFRSPVAIGTQVSLLLRE